MLDSTAAPCASHSRRYYAYGISIRSDFELPLRETFGPEGTLFDVELRLSTSPLSTEIPLSAMPRQRQSSFEFSELFDGSSYLRWEDVGEAVVSKSGRSITCHPYSQTHAESFCVYLLGQILSFAFVSNGFEPLHSTAVVIAGQAIAFLGDCGLGKSTLAASFLEAGYRLLTDDLLVLKLTPGGILAYPGPARIKLFPEVARRLLDDPANGVPMNPHTRKLVVPLQPGQVYRDALPLTAIYRLQPSSEPPHPPHAAIRVKQIRARETFVTLLGSAFNRSIVDPQRLRRHFEATHALAQVAKVKTLSYPRSLRYLERVREAVLSDLAAEGSALAACEA
jgi:hypothetical protein